MWSRVGKEKKEEGREKETDERERERERQRGILDFGLSQWKDRGPVC